MATVSHLPHVLANVLVDQAAAELRPTTPRGCPRSGPSFRDATRVAGANTAIWADIFASQPRGDRGRDRRRRRATAAGGASCCATATRERVTAGTTRAASARRALLEADLAGGAVHELRIAVPNRPVSSPSWRWRSARQASTSRTWRSTRRPTCARGAIALWVAGRRARPSARASWSASSATPSSSSRDSRWTRASTPSGRCAATLRPPPDKSISHRAALFGAMGGEPARSNGYLDAADTRSTLSAVAAARRRGRARAHRRRASSSRSAAVGLRARAEPGAEIDVGNAGTLLRLLPGWLAGQPGGAWSSTATSRSAAARWTGSPSRCGAMGALIECRDGRLPPLDRRRAPSCAGSTYTLPVASAQVKSCLLLAGPARRGPTTVDRAGAHAATTPSGCSPRRVPRWRRRPSGSRSRPSTELDARSRSRSPATSPRLPFRRRRAAGAGQRRRDRRRRP